MTRGSLRRPLVRPTPRLVLVAVAVFVIDQTAHHLTPGTSRPYTHSLPTIVVLLIAARLSDRGRVALLGVALGVASHLWRDLAEPSGSGVALFWPVSSGTCRMPALVYILSVSLLAVVAYPRATQRARLGARLIGHL